MVTLFKDIFEFIITFISISLGLKLCEGQTGHWRAILARIQHFCSCMHSVCILDHADMARYMCTGQRYIP